MKEQIIKNGKVVAEVGNPMDFLVVHGPGTAAPHVKTEQEKPKRPRGKNEILELGRLSRVKEW